MQESLFDTALTAGVLVGVVLVTTVLWVPLVRYIVLVVAASAIVIGYLHGGVSELVTHTNALEAEFIRAPTFTAGVMIGVLVTIVGVVGIRRRSAD